MSDADRPAIPAMEDLRILVVDDRPENAKLLDRLLRRWGHREVTTTTRSDDVAALCAASEYDLLLLDLHMPSPDGFAVMQQLRDQIAATVSLPVLVLTGDATDEVKRRALSGGARDFLTKPFDQHEVRLRVQNLLEIRRLQLQSSAGPSSSSSSASRCAPRARGGRLEVLERLATAGEFRDDETGEHARRVGARGRSCWPTGGRRGAETARIGVAAPLHDIGKIAIPDSLLLKAGRFTRDEHAKMQAHTRIGADMLAGTLVGSAGPRPRHRAHPPRALGRQRLSGRSAGGGDPARRAHRGPRRRLRRAHPRAPVQAGVVGGARRWRRSSAAAAGSSTRSSWRRSRSSTTRRSCRPRGMPRIAAEQHLPDVTPAQVAALWWDTGRWPSFVDGFAHVHKREGDWPQRGGRLVWDARPDSERGRVAERVTGRDADGGADCEVEDARLLGSQHVRFAAIPGGTWMTIELRYAPKGPGAPLADLVFVRRRLRRRLGRTLERFAREVAMERELAADVLDG